MRKNERDFHQWTGTKSKRLVLQQKIGIVMYIHMFRDNKIFKVFMQLFIMIPCFNGLLRS